jgi:hypothetical protein
MTDGVRNILGRNLLINVVACIEAEMEHLNSNPLPDADSLHHASVTNL